MKTVKPSLWRVVKGSAIHIEDGVYHAVYLSTKTRWGKDRYSVRVQLTPEDFVVLDGDSLDDLEVTITRVIRAALISRQIKKPGGTTHDMG